MNAKQPLCQALPLRKRKIIKKSIGRVIFCFAAIIVALIVNHFREHLLKASGELGTELARLGVDWDILLALWLVLCVASIAEALVHEYLYFRSYFYDTDGEHMVIRKGVWAKKEITLPFSKVTDVYVDQDLLDAAFRLYDVHISTPTEQSGAFAHIDGLDKPAGTELRRLLLERIKAAAARSDG